MIIRGDIADWVKSRLAEKPDLTVRALAAELCDRGTTVTHDTVWRFVRREGLTSRLDELLPWAYPTIPRLKAAA